MARGSVAGLPDRHPDQAVGSMALPPGEPLDGTYWVPALTPEPVGAFTTPSPDELCRGPIEQGKSA
jgi:hypothetical protein